MSDIAVTVTNPGSAAVTIGAGGSVSATVSSGGSVAVNLPGGEAAWANITGKPTTFTPAAHQHVAADITDRATALVTSVNGQTGAVMVSGGGGGGADLGDAVPQPLGTAAAGTSTDAARDDHVHAMPTAEELGALDDNSVVDGGSYTGYIPENTITITAQPANQTASDGAAAFSVAATVAPGGTLSYQWQRAIVSGAGATWTQRTIPYASYQSVAYGNGLFVAVPYQGNGSRVSYDGTSWTAHGAMTAFAQWQSVIYGNGLFVAVANDWDLAATSTDGIVWHAREMPFGQWRSVAYGNGVFLAVAYGTQVAATSPDGITWTSRTLPIASGWTSVVYGGGVFVVFGGGSTYLTSADGVAWTVRTMPGGFAGTRGAYGGGLFSLLSNGGQSATSPDGITWTIGQAPSAQWHGVAYGDGVFVAVGIPFGGGNGSVAASSNDGNTWTQRSLPVSAQWKAVAFGGGVFAAVSWSAAAASSASESSWSSLTGETSDQVSLAGLTQADDQSQYRVVLSAANAASVTSNAATLTVP